MASLNTSGETNITENRITRDHTETMLEAFDANIVVKKTIMKINKNNWKKELKSKNIVFDDLSSSAFL